LPSKPVTLKERTSSGGLLGAAMQLHSQSSFASDDKNTTKGASLKKARSNIDVVSCCLGHLWTAIFKKSYIVLHTSLRLSAVWWK
jgi:hypothetical protein